MTGPDRTGPDAAPDHNNNTKREDEDQKTRATNADGKNKTNGTRQQKTKPSAEQTKSTKLVRATEINKLKRKDTNNTSFAAVVGCEPNQSDGVCFPATGGLVHRGSVRFVFRFVHAVCLSLSLSLLENMAGRETTSRHLLSRVAYLCCVGL